MRYVLSSALFILLCVTYGECIFSPCDAAAGVARQDDDDLSPLHAAAASEEPDAPQEIKRLLEEGADSNALDPLGRTPLMLAAIHNPQRQTAALLIKAGAKVDVADQKGNTALHYSMGFFGTFGQPRNLAFVGELLVAKADQNARNRAGWTPLMAGALAAGCDHLLAISDPPNVKPGGLEDRTPEGWTPLMLAVASINPETWKKWLPQMPGFDPAMLQDEEGFRMVGGMFAEYARHGYVGRVWVLLRNGADPNAKANDGTTLDAILAGMNDPDALAVQSLLKVARENAQALKEGKILGR